MLTIGMAKIKEAVEEECKRVYMLGKFKGLSIAESIFLRYSENHKLLKPASNEELESWARDLMSKEAASL